MKLSEIENMAFNAVHAECTRYRNERGTCDCYCPALRACKALPLDDNEGKRDAFISAYTSWMRMRYWEENGFDEWPEKDGDEWEESNEVD